MTQWVGDARFDEVMSRVEMDETEIEYALCPMDLWLIITALQIASKHPLVKNQSISEDMEQMGRQFQNEIAALHSESKEMIEFGWIKDFYNN